VIKENDARTNRLKLFAEIYRTRMQTKPFMEIRTRYDSMTEAGLEVDERELAENYLDTGKLEELLHPENRPEKTVKSIS
jgi:hypothetical protein